MKRNLIVVIAFILIVSHVIPPNNISFANEEENDCELMDFTIQTIKENDDKLEGKASDNQKFTIEFIRQDDVEEIRSDNTGKLEYKFEEDYLKENDKIIITNEHHKIETIVVSEDADVKNIQSAKYQACEVEEDLSEPKSIEESVDQVEEETSKEPEQVVENTTKLLQDKKVEEINQDDSSTEKLVEEKNEDDLTEQSVLDDSVIKNEDAKSDEPDLGEESSLELLRESKINEEESKKKERVRIEKNSSDEKNPVNITEQIKIELQDQNTQEVHIEQDVELNGAINISANKKIIVNEGVTLSVKSTATNILSNDLMKIDIKDNASLLIESDTDGITGRNEVEIRVDNNAHLSIKSKGNGIQTDSVFNIYIAKNASFSIESRAAAIWSKNGGNINVDNAKSVDFISSHASGNLFYNNNNILKFSLKNMQIHGWNNSNHDLAASYNTPSVEGTFSFDRYETKNVDLTPNVSDFISNFSPKMSRIKFTQEEVHILNLDVNDIYESDKVINGQTESNTAVTLFDENGEEINTVKSNENGEFVFDFIKIFNKGTVLSFQSENKKGKSKVVTKTMKERTLSLIKVPDDISFGQIELQNKEDIFPRVEEDFVISIKDNNPNGNWKLSVKESKPLTNLESGYKLEEAMIFRQNDAQDQIIGATAIKIAEKNKKLSNEIQDISFKNNEGILLEINMMTVQAGTYKGQLEWTLTDGP